MLSISDFVLVFIFSGSLLGFFPKLLLRNEHGKFSGAGIALMGIGIAVLPSMIASINVLASVDIIMWQAAAVLLGVFAAKILPEKSVYLGLIVGTTIIATLGLFQVLLDIHYLVPKSDPGQFPAVTFGNRGLSALFVAMGVFPTISLMMSTDRKKFALTAALILQILFIAVCMTRSVWLGVLVAGVVWFFRGMRKNDSLGQSKRTSIQHAVLAMIASVGLVAFIVYANPNLKTLLDHRLNVNNWVNNPRIALWISVFDHYKFAPLANVFFGFGPGTLVENQAAWLKHPLLAGQTFLFLHNDFFDLIWSFGFIGSFLVLFIVTGSLISAWRAASVSRNFDWIANALVRVVTSMLFYPLSLPYFMFLFTLFTAMRKNVIGAESEISFSRLKIRYLAAPIIFIPFFFLVWKRIEIETQLRYLLDSKVSFSERLYTKAKVQESIHEFPVPVLYQKIVGQK